MRGGDRIGCSKNILIFAVCLLLLGFKSLANGHLPDGKIYRAFQFPDHLTPVIDGDLNDWTLVDESYVIFTESFHNLIDEEEAEVDPEDFSVRLMIGWNKAQNKLFVAAQVVDDIHQIDRSPGTAAGQIFMDDDMEVFLDADHSGGQYANFRELSDDEQRRLNGAEANHFIIAGPPPDDDFFVNFSAAAWYALSAGPYSAAAYALEGSTVINYELMLVPFDKVNMDAVFLSDEHPLEESEIIGLNVEFNDFDARSMQFDARWSLSGAHNAPVESGRFTDLMLMPFESIFHTEVESVTWGRIKASLTH